MVARAVGHDASRCFLVGQREHRVEGTSVFKGTGDLQVLGLHMYGTRRAGVDLIAPQDGRPARVRLDARGGGAD